MAADRRLANHGERASPVENSTKSSRTNVSFSVGDASAGAVVVVAGCRRLRRRDANLRSVLCCGGAVSIRSLDKTRRKRVTSEYGGGASAGDDGAVFVAAPRLIRSSDIVRLGCGCAAVSSSVSESDGGVVHPRTGLRRRNRAVRLGGGSVAVAGGASSCGGGGGVCGGRDGDETGEEVCFKDIDATTDEERAVGMVLALEEAAEVAEEARAVESGDTGNISGGVTVRCGGG